MMQELAVHRYFWCQQIAKTHFY